MGCKRRRPTAVPMLRASVALALAALTLCAHSDGTHAATPSLRAEYAASVVRWRALAASDTAGIVHAEAGMVEDDADLEERDGSSSSSGSTPAPTPTTEVPTTTAVAPTPAPEPTTPVPTTVAPTTLTPSTAPGDESGSNSPEPTPAPTTAPPTEETTAPPTEETTTPPTPAPETPSPTAPPAPTTSEPAPPPTTTPSVTPDPPRAPTVAPPVAPTPAPAPLPPLTPPAPPVTTTAPAVTTTLPPPTPATQSPTPTPTTKTPTPTNTPSVPSSSSGDDSKPAPTTPVPTSGGNGHVTAPDLDLTPIAGSGVISKSDKDKDSASEIGASTSAGAQNKLGTASIVLIIVGVVGAVATAVFFVHMRRRRDDKEDAGSARRRQLDAFFSYHNPLIPRTNHPGTASLTSSNGMTFAAPPPPLTPRSQIPLASSSQFITARDTEGGRFSDSVMGLGGPMGRKGRMASIPASPHGHASDFDDSSVGADSFLGGELLISDGSSGKQRPDSDRSGFSNHSSGTERQSRSRTGQGPVSGVDAPWSSFPLGLTDSRSTMVQMGLARGDGGEILRPAPFREDSSTFSIADTNTSASWDTRLDRDDSNVSSVSNPNPWEMLVATDANDSHRGVSSVSSQSTDLPSLRSTDSYTSMSDDYRSTTNDEMRFTYDSSSGRGHRAGSYPTWGTPGTEARTQRTDSYPSYGTPGMESNRSMLSFSSCGTEERPSRASSELLEGSI